MFDQVEGQRHQKSTVGSTDTPNPPLPHPPQYHQTGQLDSSIIGQKEGFVPTNTLDDPTYAICVLMQSGKATTETTIGVCQDPKSR